jgi:hypothetical protein
VTGRNTPEEFEPMTENEIRDLPTHIRERFRNIDDAAVDDHPQVVAARERLDIANTDHREAAETAHRLRTRRTQVEAFRDNVALMRQDLRETRLQTMAAALIVSVLDVNIAADEGIRDQIERFDSIIESTPLALANIDDQLIELHRRVQHRAADVSNADDALRGLVDALKLEEAQRQAA